MARAARFVLPSLLCLSLSTLPASADPVLPDFDQGVDVSKTVERLSREVREDRAPLFRAGEAGPISLDGVGFAGGNELAATIIRGEISVSCSENGRHEHQTFRCEEEVLDPAEFQSFRGPKGVDADKVTLKAVWENGKGRTKSSGYDAAEAKSTSRFNLWIATLFQRPLLNYGRNLVEYVLEKSGSEVLKGTFTANVAKAGPRYCRYRRHYSSSRLDDCRFGRSNLCDRYFRDENYCQ